MLQRSSFSSIQSLQAGVLRRSTRTRPQQALLKILLIVGVALTLSLYVYQTSKITVVTYDIRDLQNNYARLVRENTNLLAQIAYEQSVQQMTRRALAQGFQPAEVMHFIYADSGTETEDTRRPPSDGDLRPNPPPPSSPPTTP